MTSLILELHREVPSQNKRERWHWRKQRAEVKAWASDAYVYAHRRGGGQWEVFDGVKRWRKASWVGFGKRRIVVTAYRARLCDDYANLVGGCKGLIDGLVKAGLLVDDSMEWMAAEYRQELRSHPCNPAPRKACTVVEVWQEESA